MWENQFRYESFINEKLDHRIWDVFFVLCPQ